MDTNFTVHDKPCRIMVGPILGIYGPILLWVLLALQSPAYLFYLTRIWKIFLAWRKSPDCVDPSAQKVVDKDMGRKAGGSRSARLRMSALYWLR